MKSKWIDKLEKIEGQRLSKEAIRRKLKFAREESVMNFLSNLGRLPWVNIDRNQDGIEVSVDRGLYELIERHKVRSVFDGRSVLGELRELRAELIRRRKANHDERKKHNWNPEVIITREQTLLLDWIEERLDAITAEVPNGHRGQQSA
jgi:hypothetical protein